MALAGAKTDTAYGAQPKSRDRLMSRVGATMQLAYSRHENRGAPGIDGMRCEDPQAWLKGNWSQVKRTLLDGTYRPKRYAGWTSCRKAGRTLRCANGGG